MTQTGELGITNYDDKRTRQYEYMTKRWHEGENKKKDG